MMRSDDQHTRWARSLAPALAPAMLLLAFGTSTAIAGPRWDPEPQRLTSPAPLTTHHAHDALPGAIDDDAASATLRNARLAAPSIETADFDPTGLKTQRVRDRLFDAIEGTIDTSRFVDFRGETPFSETVRYIEDFEDTSVERPAWTGLRTREFDAMSRVAGPFRNNELSVRIESKVGELYMLRFDLALIGARLGSENASDTFVVEIDGEPLLQKQISEFTAEAMEQRESFSDPLIADKRQLFFRAGHRISTITFRSEAAGAPGGEVWGLDNIVIDRVLLRPADLPDEAFYPASGGGGGGVGGGFASPGIRSGGGVRGGSGSSGGGSGNPFNPRDARLPDLIPPDDPMNPAPDLPPTERPGNRPPRGGSPPGDDPPPPDAPPPPDIPSPGTGVVFGLGALMMGRRRRKD